MFWKLEIISIVGNTGFYIFPDHSGEGNLGGFFFFHLIFQIIAVVPPHFSINIGQMAEER